MMPTSRTGDNRGIMRIFGASAEKEGVSLSAIRRRAQRQLSKFDAAARSELAERAISMPPGIGLVGCPNCELALNGEHPQAEALLGWISGNVKLAKNFKEVEVLFEMLRLAENPGQTFDIASCFHIGLTSAGPVAFFQDHPCPLRGNA